MIEGTESEKLILINNLIIETIKNVSKTEEAEEGEPDVVDSNKEAQATLKGSVGGVQGILGIQKSVSEGVTQYDAALTLLKEIYGFSEEVATDLLGTRKELEKLVIN